MLQTSKKETKPWHNLICLTQFLLRIRVNAEHEDLSGVQLYPVELVTVDESLR